MRSVELVVVNLVAAAPESPHEPAAAHVDGQHSVVQAVGQEKTGGPVARTRCHKAGRKRDEVGKEVTIGEAHGQRVGSAVGETAEGKARWIHGVPPEGLVQNPVEHTEVRAEGVENQVPCRPPGFRREKHESGRVRKGKQWFETLLRVPSGSVEHHR